MALDTISTGALEALDDQLTQGVPTLGWPGDPKLQVELGVITAGRSGFSPEVGRYVRKGEVVARRIEVWKNTERHGRQQVGRWLLSEYHTIIPDLVKMDPSRPRHKSVEDRIDKHNAEIEAKQARAHRDVMGELMEHAHSLHSGRRMWTPGIPSTWNGTPTDARK